MKNFLGGAALSVLLCGVVQSTPAQENYGSWTYVRNIVLNTMPSGATIQNSVTQFPVLIRLTSADSLVFKNSQSNGGDIRFSKWNGAHLPFQVAQWNSTARSAVIWVLVDTVKANDSAEGAYPKGYLKMYFGKSSAPDSSNGATVFDTSAGFQAVWHLNDVGNTNAGGYLDATPNALNATGIGTSANSDTLGIIGTAQSFDGATEYLTIGTTGISGAVPRTISGWVLGNYTPTGTARATAFGYAPNSTTNDAYFDFTGNGATPNFYQLYLRAGGNNDITTNTSTNDLQWHYLVGTYDGTNANAYVDVNSVGSFGATLATVDGFFVGYNQRYTEFFQGAIEEVRVDNVARSADWITLSFQNQQASQTLVNLGAVLLTNGTAALGDRLVYKNGEIGYAGVISVYSFNGQRLKAVSFDASATKSMLLKNASRGLAMGPYLYRLAAAGNSHVMEEGKIAVDRW